VRWLTAVLLATAPCGASPDVAPSDATHQLEQAQRLWEHAAPHAYSYSVKYSAFVLEFGCEVQRYRVSGSRSTPLAASSCKSRPDVLGSVPALFGLIHKLLRDGYKHIDMSFDGVLGYPKSVYVGNDEFADDYFAFEISGFSSNGQDAPPNNRWRGP